ncbi:MAG: hypothetical protein O3B84_05660 [Chloroflexi bacterium]|nr:hypothetical protein [Chloroflexota bacterium]
MIHFEAHLNEGIGFCVYDSSKITTAEMLEYLALRAKNWPATLVADGLLGEAVNAVESSAPPRRRRRALGNLGRARSTRTRSLTGNG